MSATDVIRPARDLTVRPALSRRDRWQVSWGEGTQRITLEATAEIASVLATLSAETTREDVVTALAAVLPAQTASDLAGQLIAAGALLTAQGSMPASEARWMAMNWNDALVLHRATRNMIWRHEYPPNAQIMMWTNHNEPVPIDRPRPVQAYDDIADTLLLPQPDMGLLRMPLTEVFQLRRTKRSFKVFGVRDQLLSTLLHSSFRPIIQGETRRYFTTLSSADGYREKHELHPLTVHVIFGRSRVIDGQEDAVYRYNPVTHALQAVNVGRLRDYFAFSRLLWGQDFADDAPVGLLLSVNWDQFMWKYRTSHGYRFAHYDLGAYMQTALMGAAALGLSAFITPAIDDVRVARLLGSQESISAPAYFLAIGAGGGEFQPDVAVGEL